MLSTTQLLRPGVSRVGIFALRNFRPSLSQHQHFHFSQEVDKSETIATREVQEAKKIAIELDFYDFEDTDTWLSKQPVESIINHFNEFGFVNITNIVNHENLSVYQNMYNLFLSNKIDASSHRHDLGSNESRKLQSYENITQIMWPSVYISNLEKGPFHTRAEAISQILLDHSIMEIEYKNDDQDKDIMNYKYNNDERNKYNLSQIGFDFDMMLFKESQSLTDVPWHQDSAYWPKELMEHDWRAFSFWLALDDVNVNNGCMQFLPWKYDNKNKNKNKNNNNNNNSGGKVDFTDVDRKWLFNHVHAKEKCHVLKIDDDRFGEYQKKYGNGYNGIAIPLSGGSCTIHSGITPHYTKGNSTNNPRKALVACYRPQEMVQLERSIGFDHGKGGLDNVLLKSSMS